MILVDKDIVKRIEQGDLISEGFNRERLNGVSYDLTVSCIIDTRGDEQAEYMLSPGETVFIKTNEKLKMSHDILGRIAEKNSRMRQGLKVDGSHYQPGHETFAFFARAKYFFQEYYVGEE